MDYSKYVCLSYLMCILVLVIFVPERTCGSFPRRTSPAKRTCPTLKLTNGFVRLRSKGRIGRYICKDGFKIVGERTATCVRGQWEGNPPLCVKSGCLKVYAPKNGHVMEFYAGGVLNFVCDNGYSLNGSRNIFCDGISWNGSVPTCKVDNAEPETFCDFENEDLCSWTQGSQHNFDWRRHSLATPSGHVGTGPSYDHTKGKGLDGHYMYIESSSPRMVNDTARLFSPVYPAVSSEDGCFVFWYHMFGATTGYLRVYQKPDGSNLTSLKPLFSKSGDQGNKWIRGIVRLEEINTPFQIIVEGVRGTSYVSDSAIDDVLLTNGTDCVEPEVDTSQSPPPRIETGGGGEVYDDAQSCRLRCTSNPNYSVSPDDDSAVETPVMVTCDCHVGCLDNATCCPDYSSYCIMAKVTPLPAVPPLEHRTVATIHYFPRPTFSRPLPPLLQPPPLPPLPPKPTTPPLTDLPYTTQSKDLNQNTEVDQQKINPQTFEDSSVIPTSISFSEIQTTNLIINMDETYPGNSEFSDTNQFQSTTINTVDSDDLESEFTINNIEVSQSSSVSTSSYTNRDTIILINTETTIIKPLPLTTAIDEAATQVKTTFSSVFETSKLPSTTFRLILTNVDQTTPIWKLPKQQVTTLEEQHPLIETTTTMPTKLTTTMKPTTLRKPITYPMRIPFFTKKPTTLRKPITYTLRIPFFTKKPTLKPTQPPTTTEAARKSTKNKMMYYPNSSGDKSKEAETNYLLRKELMDQPKGRIWQQPQQSLQEPSSISASTVIGVVGGVALLLIAFSVVTVAVVRRRRAAGGRNTMSDDSDVRFLTADEVLDFNLARPNDEEDRC